MKSFELIKPHRLNLGDTIGVFTPSTPGYKLNPELFQNGIKNIEKAGFKVKLGSITKSNSSQGYRSGTPKERASEFMGLIEDPEVKCLISTIGGSNSNSMIEYLDFKKIRNARKLICGYSDVTSLHLGILKYSRLSTIYGPSIMTWWGEFPSGVQESDNSFLEAVLGGRNYPYEQNEFPRWSNHLRSWGNDDWKTVPRIWQKNNGWKVLSDGNVESKIIVANLNTLMSAAGTNYFPNFDGKILLIEEMLAPLSRVERSLTQLKLMGVFDKINGLIMGKPEVYKKESAPFDLNDLLLEVIGKRDYPIISNFDCGHTIPMISIAQETRVRLKAEFNKRVEFVFLESFVV